ncbi:hypothetical protein YC2023_069687 [Brassica napus]
MKGETCTRNPQRRNRERRIDCFIWQAVSDMRKEISKSGLLNTVQLVITSPLRRAMQTSVGIFRGQEDMNQSDIFPKVNNSPPIVALEICRERMGLYPCDKRESISTYRTYFSEIDFTMVVKSRTDFLEIQNDHDLRVMKMLNGKQRRGKTWKRFLLEAFTFSNVVLLRINKSKCDSKSRYNFVELWERPEKDIAVVSHGIFLQQTLRALHEKVGTPVEENHLKRFANCELRSIRLEKR